MLGELDYVIARDGRIGLARGAAAVRVAAIDLLPEEPLRHRAWLGQLQRQRGQRACARQLELARRERRMQGHVPEQVEHEPRLVAQRIGRDREEIVSRGRRKRSAHPFNRRRDLLCAATVSALGKELGRQIGQPLLARRVVNPAGAEGESHGDHRLLVVLDHDEL